MRFLGDKLWQTTINYVIWMGFRSRAAFLGSYRNFPRQDATYVAVYSQTVRSLWRLHLETSTQHLLLYRLRDASGLRRRRELLNPRQCLARTFVLECSSSREPLMKLYVRLALPKFRTDIVELVIRPKRKHSRDWSRARYGQLIALKSQICRFVNIMRVVLHFLSPRDQGDNMLAIGEYTSTRPRKQLIGCNRSLLCQSAICND